jgi:hypothetical protein
MMGTRRCNPGFTGLAIFAACATGVFAFAVERPIYVPPPKLSKELPSAAVATGPRLRKALQEAVPGASWKQAILRDALRQLAESHSLAILRDRRIDPTALIDLTASSVSLEELFSQLAEPADADVRIVGNVVYLAPPESANVIRTLIALRDEELSAHRSRTRSARQTALRRNETVRWADLTTPADALQLVAKRFDLKIEGSELVPYDLWEHAVFAQMTASEMLSLVLIQFDLTFEWGSDLRSVRLVPLPEDRSEIVVRRAHRPKKTKPGEAMALWKQKAGDFEATVEGDRVNVLARIEQHELIEQLIRGDLDSGNDKPAEPVPLSRRQFTLAVSGVAASAVMKQLEASGISFEFDRDAFEDAGVNFEQPISMDVSQVGATEFLRELFEPLGLKVRFSGTRVMLELPESPR